MTKYENSYAVSVAGKQNDVFRRDVKKPWHALVTNSNMVPIWLEKYFEMNFNTGYFSWNFVSIHRKSCCVHKTLNRLPTTKHQISSGGGVELKKVFSLESTKRVMILSIITCFEWIRKVNISGNGNWNDVNRPKTRWVEEYCTKH